VFHTSVKGQAMDERGFTGSWVYPAEGIPAGGTAAHVRVIVRPDEVRVRSLYQNAELAFERNDIKAAQEARYLRFDRGVAVRLANGERWYLWSRLWSRRSPKQLLEVLHDLGVEIEPGVERVPFMAMTAIGLRRSKRSRTDTDQEI
jgi:hypothetical protein